MSRSKLQRTIRNRQGVILSEATHKTSNLLQATHAIVKRFELLPDFKAELFVLACKSDDDLDYGTSSERASELWNEQIVDYFNMIAPKGYYFGAHEGNGSCFGWFKITKDMAVI